MKREDLLSDYGINVPKSIQRTRIERAKFQPGNRVAHYKLLTLESNSMSRIFLAENQQQEKFIAKVYGKFNNRLQSINENCMREIKLLTELDHPNIIKIIEIVETAKSYCLIFPFYGDDLGKTIELHGSLNILRVRNIARDILEALAYIHDKGFIHMDVKPDNILLGPENKAILIDFSVSVCYKSKEVRPQGVVGHQHGHSFLFRNLSSHALAALHHHHQPEHQDNDGATEDSTHIEHEHGLVFPIGGTLQYLPPEIITQYCQKMSEQPSTHPSGSDGFHPQGILSAEAMPLVDVWMLGITIYTLSFAMFPFYSEDTVLKLEELICKGSYPIPSNTSPYLVGLLKAMVNTNVAERKRPKELLEMDFFKCSDAELGFGQNDDIARKILETKPLESSGIELHE